ncbi:MAG: Fe(3+) ABC transporter substrate-binding protein [Gammaproteobacteria bacterium]|nr:Fe(3+) ABC transporter substrate-binding protein [Gammaproteobacteria bacterium]
MSVNSHLLKLFLIVTILVSNAAIAAEEINLYSARKEKLIKPLLDRFTQETGIKVNMVTGKADALLKRLKSEGMNSPADLLITTDAGRLHRAKTSGVTQAVNSKQLEQAIPENFRDPDGHWFGLTLRARPIMYVKGRVTPSQLSTYEDLADAKWKGKICIRSSSNIYNQSLVSSLITANGLSETERWASDLVKNLARTPKGGDRDQIKAAVAGMCDLAIANTYYLAGMLTSKDESEREIAQQMGLFWPNQESRGAHVNVSGIALTHSAKNRDNAIKLAEFLTSKESQKWYAETNGEYPVVSGVEASATLKQWGEFKFDPLNLSFLGKLNPDAVRLMDRAGWK